MFINSLKISKISYFLSLIVMITINSKVIAKKLYLELKNKL